MRYRKTKNYKEKLADLDGKTYIHMEEKTKMKWQSSYMDSKPVMLEIGCGKGGFLLELARRNKDINYIGVEKNEALLLEAAITAMDENLSNIKFTSFDANNIEDYFEKLNLLYIFYIIDIEVDKMPL